MVGTEFDTATTSLASRLIIHAENEVDKYLSRRYDVSQFNTSTAVPPLVTSLTETLAEGYMYQRMSRGGKEAMARANDLIKMAVNNLNDIANYKLDLVDTAGSSIVDMSQTAYRVLCNTSDYTPTFAEDNELDWEVDTDKLDDIDSARD